ncbi:MAG: hypothetical protein AAF841_11380 [Pseudomonadota bacterium]
MVGNSKVLTVSYGTFSCTLEGFEDSFEMMKSITEYFRDLAAEDPHFGAEPAKLDPHSLARAAEQRLSRQVEARAEGDNIVLSPAAGLAAPAAAAALAGAAALADGDEDETPKEAQSEPAPQEEAAPATEASADISEPAPELEPEAQSEPEAEPEPEPEPRPEPETTDIAPLEATVDPEIEAAVEEIEEELAATEALADIEEKPIDGVDNGDDGVGDTAAEIENDAEARPQTDADVESEADAREDAIEPAAAEAALAEPEPEPEPVAEPVAEPVDEAEIVAEPEAEPAEEGGLAAKLRRIQAVVGASKAAATAADAAPAPTDEFTEDEHAEDFSEGAEDMAEAEDAPEAAREPAQDTDAPEIDPTREAAQENAEQETEDVAQERPRVLKMKRADFEAAMAKAQGNDANAQDDTDAGPEAESENVASERLASAQDVDAPDAEEPVESSLSPEDEAELLAELAAAEEATQAAGDAAPAAETPIAAEDFEEDGANAPVDHEPETPEAAMNRLMDEAEAQLGEPAAKSRREAYSHLKAAVAAKQAARSMGEADESAPAEREGVYRDDLAQVVRPRRAAQSTGATARPRPAAAPLKLVASQRVDLAESAPEPPAAPVRPRRVAAQQKSEAAPEAPKAAKPAKPAAPVSDFAGFAARFGATGLPDILEAAAAYTTHVEGNAIFSRPQVMRMIKDALPDERITREDGLRAFGTLLREGRIHKIRGGQFEVTSDTRFQPEAMEMQAAG